MDRAFVSASMETTNGDILDATGHTFGPMMVSSC